MITLPFPDAQSCVHNHQEGIKGVVRFEYKGFEISIQNHDRFPGLAIYRGANNVTRMFFNELEVDGTVENIAIAVQRINEYIA